MASNDVILETIAEAHGVSKKAAAAIVKTFLEGVVDTAKREGEVRLNGFGTFKVVEKAARTARNPATGGMVEVPAKKVFTFKVSKGLNLA